MNKSSFALSNYFENISLFILGLFLLMLPLFFLSVTTDAFVLPKQVALSFTTGLFFLFFGLKTITQGKLSFRSSPFDLPVILFVLVLFLSAIFSTNRYDALIAFVPFLFIAFLYFGIVNIVRSSKQLLFILSSLVLGAVISSIFSIFTFFKIYLLPFAYTHTPSFSTFGSLMDQALYFAFVLPIAGYFVYEFITARKNNSEPFANSEHARKQKQSSSIIWIFGSAAVIMLVGFGISLSLLFTSQKPLILPLEIGLQTGFAAISQDAGNIFKSFLLGSGTGTFLTDFTRFKAATYNNYASLWSFTFFRSSSFALELLATTGILGIAAFIFLVVRIVKERTFFLPLAIAIIAAFVLPFSFTPTLVFFILLAIFAITRIYNNEDLSSEIEFYFVAAKRKGIADAPEAKMHQKRYGRFLSVIVSLLLLIIIGVPLYFVTRFFISDLIFQQSLVAASKNQGLQTYNLQIAALRVFPYRDVYYRAFSQTNLALANSLVAQQAQQKTKPNPEVQKNILTLIQQSIDMGRNATSVAPLTSFNWNNLSSIYRSLIGFGENADKFAVLTSQQAVNLDPTNPQQYIELGGIYYQLGAYNDAIRQFQYAIGLKNDYANAYYNLGHALEMSGNLDAAMQAYEKVKQLVAKDANNTKLINTDIEGLKQKAGADKQKQSNASQSANLTQQTQPDTNQPLNVNEPATKLPERNPRVSIPAPTVSPLPSPKKASPTPTLPL